MPQTSLRWPPAADEPQLKPCRIRAEVIIRADPASVLAYASNASRWQEWHPATRRVAPLPDRPLRTGETILEDIRAGGRRFTAVWEVLAADPPSLWVIATDTAGGFARISYQLEPLPADAQGPRTRFVRTLDCRSRGWLRGLDRWLLPLALVRQSRQALERLRARVEATKAA